MNGEEEEEEDEGMVTMMVGNIVTPVWFVDAIQYVSKYNHSLTVDKIREKERKKKKMM